MDDQQVTRFTLIPGHWYAVEFIGDEFSVADDFRSHSAIRVDSVITAPGGQRCFDLSFYHANYPEGVRDKVYTLQTVEAGQPLYPGLPCWPPTRPTAAHLRDFMALAAVSFRHPTAIRFLRYLPMVVRKRLILPCNYQPSCWRRGPTTASRPQPTDHSQLSPQYSSGKYIVV